MKINKDKKDEKFPVELFGLEVGKKYKLGTMENNDYGNLPIKKMTGIERFLGRGFHLYFQPIKEHSRFEYIENKQKPDDKYFSTSFHTYFLPVIPNDIQNMEELQNKLSSFEVQLIKVNWSKNFNNNEDAYFWAADLCQTFKSYLGYENENIDYYKDKWRSCTFRSGEIVLEISNISSRSDFSLSIDKKQFEILEKAVDETIRRLEAKKILQ